jgi:hypothetical protein
MLSKGRFPLLPKTINGKKEVRKILAQPKSSATKTRRHKKKEYEV